MRFSTIAILFSAAASASANTLWAHQNLPGEYNVVLVCYVSNTLMQHAPLCALPVLTSVVVH